MFHKNSTHIIQEKRKNLSSVRTGILCLLTLYAVVFVSSSGVPHMHHADGHQNEDSCKTDACHISIYHPGAEGGCTHKAHLSGAVDDCHLCHLVIARDHLLTKIPFEVGSYASQTAEFWQPDQIVILKASFRAGRSPPVSA